MVSGGSAIDVYSYAFYALVATVVILAVIAGVAVVGKEERRPRRRSDLDAANKSLQREQTWPNRPSNKSEFARPRR